MHKDSINIVTKDVLEPGREVADSAGTSVSQLDRVFDLRVMQSLTRMGLPVAEAVRALARRIAGMSKDLNTFIATQQGDVADTARTGGKSASRVKRKPVAQTSRRTRRVA